MANLYIWVDDELLPDRVVSFVADYKYQLLEKLEVVFVGDIDSIAPIREGIHNVRAIINGDVYIMPYADTKVTCVIQPDDVGDKVHVTYCFTQDVVTLDF